VAAVQVADHRVDADDRLPFEREDARNTPWADGCCGPMFMVSRSLPA
jgi:hypothetical protein